MKILLTGATGYIGKRLLPVLIEAGHELICAVRDPRRFHPPASLRQQLSVVEVDLLQGDTLHNIPKDIDGAFYLVHSMSGGDNYYEREERCAINFRDYLSQTQARHVVYLSGMVNEADLSWHLRSRLNVEEQLRQGDYHFTVLRAGIVVGSGSASFEIIRDLVEKLPLMIAPRWLNTRCQPIGVTDIVMLLAGTVFRQETYDQVFDVGGADVLTYKEMLLAFAEVRGLKRYIYSVPVMTPRLSSYWLYFVTSTTYNLAVALVDSMKVEVVARDNRLVEILDRKPISYREALRRAFRKIESNEIVSSWKDAYASSGLDFAISDFIQVPTYGCFKDQRRRALHDRERTIEKVWRIGGDTGWYYGNWLWAIRGLMDKMVGGVGLRRGRTNPDHIQAGDALDFWRVLYANKEEGRLLLFAEMRLPGEAWLEFREKDGQLVQTATFRPLGVWGRLYWYAVLPFHGFIFRGMIDYLVDQTSA